jgi:LPPG:FO 2-phospho-L-lactate transferase
VKVVALAGGVGGAKLVDGLARCLPPEDLSVVVNTGDDFTHLGLKICPDLDTVCYTLAGLADPTTGWGRANESWNFLGSLEQLGGSTWFHLGDRDLATHVERTQRLEAGQPLNQIVGDFCKAWGIRLTVLPMSDDLVSTWVYTDEGTLPFQEYFVGRQCQPRVRGFYFAGIESALPSPGVLEALENADLVIICPSNPWVSIDPILAVAGMRSAIAARPVVAVSPIIGGTTVKGPAAKMYTELGIQPSAVAVTRHYSGLLKGFVIDQKDQALQEEIQALDIQVLVTNTLMNSIPDRQTLAGRILDVFQRGRN